MQCPDLEGFPLLSPPTAEEVGARKLVEAGAMFLALSSALSMAPSDSWLTKIFDRIGIEKAGKAFLAAGLSGSSKCELELGYEDCEQEGEA